jgi:hypothetical protein
MITVSRTLLALAVCMSAAAFVSQVSAQVDTQKAPPGPPNTISAHQMAALKKCTDGKKFAGDKYVAAPASACPAGQRSVMRVRLVPRGSPARWVIRVV